MQSKLYKDLNDLPACYAALFEATARQNFYASRPWFRTLVETTREAGDGLQLYGLEDDAGAAVALLVARNGVGGIAGGRAGDPRALSGFSTMYTTHYLPLIHPTAVTPEAAAEGFARALAAEKPAWQVMNFDALDPAEPFFPAFETALRGAGFVVQSYAHFGNWYESTEGDSLESFMARRPSALRNTVKRKGRKLEKMEDVSFEIITDDEGVGRAMDAYDAIYANSWKEPEPFPEFTRRLVKEAAAAACLCMGTVFLGDRPAASQIWIVSGGRATIFKLAYDEEFKKLSAGSVLTVKLLEHVLNHNDIVEVDYGRGDDAYKKQWLSQRRERRGIVAFNPRTLTGAIGALRHVGGSRLKLWVGR
ncbi:GNAT family N-acetyltransferase [Denitrobaculum tricleocarpae]|uniref:GNAT family N-acetyltransferase n=1 Tax=Denitrobaculum tricleocarpae TaxID=2591009 RepID=A0A545TGA7_9PROT|nr:GNAT family N-acetyltransferase [Denitrobaculum tricleocarpae]TQV76262.1 GNAT family N-acetyltransferase [Denitrobaculum tricleocarpae]